MRETKIDSLIAELKEQGYDISDHYISAIILLVHKMYQNENMLLLEEQKKLSTSISELLEQQKNYSEKMESGNFQMEIPKDFLETIIQKSKKKININIDVTKKVFLFIVLPFIAVVLLSVIYVYSFKEIAQKYAYIKLTEKNDLLEYYPIVENFYNNMKQDNAIVEKKGDDYYYFIKVKNNYTAEEIKGRQYGIPKYSENGKLLGVSFYLGNK